MLTVSPATAPGRPGSAMNQAAYLDVLGVLRCGRAVNRRRCSINGSLPFAREFRLAPAKKCLALGGIGT